MKVVKDSGRSSFKMRAVIVDKKKSTLLIIIVIIADFREKIWNHIFTLPSLYFSMSKFELTCTFINGDNFLL